jgi:hypothetical protein
MDIGGGIEMAKRSERAKTTFKRHAYEVYALLMVSYECQDEIKSLLQNLGVPRRAIQPSLHLTVYHARRRLPSLTSHTQAVSIVSDVSETRFMILAPGGENPRPELEPAKRSLGIRLTKRNRAIEEIQALRKQLYALETREVIGQRKRTTAWTNAFGARHYQPHVKLLRPGSKIDRDLTIIGEAFRSRLEFICFDRFRVRCGVTYV